jgi:hypothetical protein
MSSGSESGSEPAAALPNMVSQARAALSVLVIPLPIVQLAVGVHFWAGAYTRSHFR